MPSNQAILGELGESNIIQWNRKCGIEMYKSPDRMDSVKDVMWVVDGVEKLGEVKTETPYLNRGAFTFRQTQEYKCFTKDKLFLVTCPVREFKGPKKGTWYTWGGCFFEASNPGDLKFDYYNQRFYDSEGTVKMVSIPFDQPGLKLIHRINQGTEEELWKNLIKYSSTKLKS